MMDTRRPQRVVLAFLSAIFGGAGLVALWHFDWRVSVGAFLIVWSRQIDRALAEMRREGGV